MNSTKNISNKCLILFAIALLVLPSLSFSTPKVCKDIAKLDFKQIKAEGTTTEIDGYSVRMVPAKNGLKGAVFAIQGLNNNFRGLKLLSESITKAGYNYYEVLLPGNDKNEHSARRGTWLKTAEFLNRLAEIDRVHHQSVATPKDSGTIREQAVYRTVGMGYSTGSAVWLHSLKQNQKASLDSYILIAPPTSLRPKWGIIRFFLNPYLWFRSYNLGLKGNVPEELRAHVKTPVWSHHTLLGMIDEMENIEEFSDNFPKAKITAIVVSEDEFTHTDHAWAFFKNIGADFRVVKEDLDRTDIYRHLFIHPQYGGENNFKVLANAIIEKLN